MPNRRLPGDLGPNEITELLERKRRSGARILDLTESNPTRVGLGGAGPPELRALAEAGGATYEPHPRGTPGAREAVARYYEGRTGSVSPEDLVLVASTSEAYAHLLRLLCEPGDEILVPRPSYPLFEPLAALEDVRVERYRLAYHEGWRLDLVRRELRSSDDTLVVLSGSEFDLLVAFVEHSGRVLSRETLMDLARGTSHEAYDRSIDVQVSRLRHKLEQDPKNPSLIRTIRNAGYLFHPKVERG